MIESADSPRPAASVQDSIDAWRHELVELGGPNTLLWGADRAGTALDLTHAHPGGLAKLLSDRDTRLSELFREPAASQLALDVARNVTEKVSELERERGLPGCFLAVGLATWADIHRVPGAPVFLRRCQVRPLDPGQNDFVVELRGGLEFNPVLRDYLENVRGLSVPGPVLARMCRRGSGFDPSPAYAALDRIASGLRGWEITHRLLAAAFPYGKLPALADFSRAAPSFAAHPVLSRLVVGSDAEGARDNTSMTSAAPTAPDEVLVLDADPAQIAVVEAVRAGRSVVVDAGPGTGKSQTIVNVVADSVRSGRSVLVVAAPQGARQAIGGRLRHLGLGHLVYEPGRLETAGSVDPSASSPTVERLDIAATRQSWTRSRHALDGHVQRMHALRAPWTVTLDDVQSRLVELAQSPIPARTKVRLSGAELAAIDKAGLEEWTATITRLAERDAWRGDGAEVDPWFGATIDTASDELLAREALAGLSKDSITALRATFDEVFEGVAIPALPTLGHFRDVVAELATIRKVLEVFRTAVFDTRLDALTDPVQRGFRDRWRRSRDVKALLRPGAPSPDVEALLAQARAVEPLWRHVRNSEILPSQVLHLDLAQAAYDVVAEHVGFLQAHLRRPRGATKLIDLPLRELDAEITRLTERADRLAVLPDVSDDLRRARSAGLGPLVEDLAARGVPPGQVADEVALMWWASILAEVTRVDDGYAGIDGGELRALAWSFRRADIALQRNLVDELSRSAVGEGRDPRCWLLSPLAVGLCIPAGRTFDVTIVDVASGVTTAQAASALARSPQALIVGDSRQPPPAAFVVSPGSQPSAPPGGSLLDDAITVLPVFRLPNDYRSRDPRLVAYVNSAAYGDSIRALPSPRGEPPIRLALVEGVGEIDSASRTVVTTPVEVERVVELVREWAQTRGGQSLGVITLEAEHARRIRAAIRLRAGSDETLARFLETQGEEPFYVSVASHAVGETRDGIIVSLGFGKTAHGATCHTFGVLESAEGDRLLTAALTHARADLTLASGVGPADLTPEDEFSGKGARMLRELLIAAEQRDPAHRSGDAPAIVADLARRLRARGLTVTENFGDQIDLAVEDPLAGSPAQPLAIEVDGVRYAAARGVRERERLRPEQLHRLGWRHLRVLTVDLFRDPAREEARIMATVDELRSRSRDNRPMVSLGRPAEQPPDDSVHALPTTAPAAAVVTPRPPSVRRRPQSREQTRDDTDEGWGEGRDEGPHDQWLRENRPPHWD